MSHELRTLVAALQSIAENMPDGVVGPGAMLRSGKLVALQAERLSAMVADVLEFGRRQQRPQGKTYQSADVPEAINEAILASAVRLEEQGFKIEKDVPADLPFARCSAAALRQSIQNLLSNSIKHGVKGRWVRITARDSGQGQVAISVEDKGCGIRRDELRTIFEPFSRGQDAQASQIPGAGLGLA